MKSRREWNSRMEVFDGLVDSIDARYAAARDILDARESSRFYSAAGPMGGLPAMEDQRAGIFGSGRAWR